MGAPLGGGMPANMVPCRFCKEPIMRGARKCKHCGEYQNDADRQQAKNMDEGDPTLSVTDWIGVFCCPVIGILQGAIYCGWSQKARGLRLIKYCGITFVLGIIANICIQIVLRILVGDLN